MTDPDRERLPTGVGIDWRPDLGARLQWGNGVVSQSAWRNRLVFVISSLTNAELPDGTGTGLQWHVSMSRKGKRPRTQDIKRVLRAFRMVGAEEDNHHPGVARHFWMPVEARHRVDCECKAEEVVVIEPDGYKWTNPHGEQECRGCELERMTGKACPIHTASATRETT